MRIGHDLLAAAPRLDPRRRLGQAPPGAPGAAPRGGQDRLVPCGDRLVERAGRFWGAQTGPNPTDRGKAGSKHHVLTDGNGIPLAARTTGANRHDVTQLDGLVDDIPPVPGKAGRPRRRPDALYGDRGYDSQPHRDSLRALGITPRLAQRGDANGSGLGKVRWVVERTLAWLHQNRRLRVRYEKRADIHDGFLKLGCAMICFKRLQPSFC
jgi:transposase